MALIKCPECSTDVSDSAAVCMKCGFAISKPAVRQDYAHPVASSAPSKSPEVAVILNFVWSGIGNIYIGQIVKGVIVSLAYGILMTTVMLKTTKDQEIYRNCKAMDWLGDSSCFPLSGGSIFIFIVMAAFWTVMLISVYNDAKKLQTDSGMRYWIDAQGNKSLTPDPTKKYWLDAHGNRREETSKVFTH